MENIKENEFDYLGEKLHEECGVFGIYDNTENSHVAMDTYHALFALQHRGQESCGIAINDDGVIDSYKDTGLLRDVFNKNLLDSMDHGQIAIGHCKYGTSQGVGRQNAQPLVIRHIKGHMAIAHNGNLVNSGELRRELELQGAIFQSNSDAEVMAHEIIRERLKTGSIEEAVESAMNKFKGAYSMVLMSPTKLIAVRDPVGFRPLCMGKMPEGQIVFASESCGLDAIGATFVRDIKAGEIVVVNKDGVRSIETHCSGKSTMCVFEFVYFARPDSVIEGASVHNARLRAGAFLALSNPVQADVVIGVPDSGLDAALGFARQSGIPYGVGFIKNRYIARTFIEPTQRLRENAVKLKLSVVEATVKDKRVVLIDDSIVRGTTSARIVRMLKEAGAKEVHVRISSPPFIAPCYFGTDIDGKNKLIACQMSIDEICKKIDADSLGFLPLENVCQIAENASCKFCDGCFSEKYPISVDYEPYTSKFDKKIK